MKLQAFIAFIAVVTGQAAKGPPCTAYKPFDEAKRMKIGLDVLSGEFPKADADNSTKNEYI